GIGRNRRRCSREYYSIGRNGRRCMMGRFINSILNNDSVFGQIMTRCGIIIGANLMFCIFCLPVITIGPSVTALYHVMFKTLRGDGVLNPFKEFWIGFRNNFKQSVLYWLFVIVIAVIAFLDLRFANYMGGIMNYFRYGIYAIVIAVIALTAYLFPVIACFADTLPALIRNAIFFIARNPFKMLLIAAVDLVPLYFCYMDVQRLPLWGFLWVTFGFGAVAMFGANLMLKDFSKFLPEKKRPDQITE
ncbi:MAG: YesL family protein, partial [Lachnospiraceae bacterium]|nr:YesL family protein [Lachnospiraceae bacterium]